MSEASVADGRSACCAHCGLPVTVRITGSDSETYCCNACRLVARIIGRQSSGQLAWNILRLALGTILAMNVMMISLLLYTGEAEPATVPAFRMTLLILSATALIILLYPFVAGAWKELRRARISIDSLIAGGAIAAFSVSAVNTLRGTGHIYFDTATMLPVLVTFGKIIESAAKSRSAELLRALETLLPPSALKIEENGLVEVPVAEIRPDDEVRVRPGERVPVDGLITDGTTLIAESTFTGESAPRGCGPGDRVIAGTVNGPGSIRIKVTGTGADTLLGQVVAMTDRALRNPARSERLAEKAATIFVPAVLLVALCAGVFWIAAGDPARGGLSALAVLVVACPCTMGIATPLATSVAIARAAQAGVVVRGGDVMEKIGRTDLCVFDKTGTLTEPVPRIQDILMIDPAVTEGELLGRLAALEGASEHVIAKAVTEEASARRIVPGVAAGISVVPGSGISGTVSWGSNTEEVFAGTASFAGCEDPPSSAKNGRSEVWVSWGGQVRGRVTWTVALRPDAAATVAELEGAGIGTVLLSGDTRSAAAAVATQLGIGRVEAPRQPAEKLAFVTAAVETGRTVMMVGDGINDGPALAAASVGVAVGGLDLIRQTGNVSLLSSGLARIPWLIRLSRKSRSVICQNFAWTFAYNGIAIAAAAAGLLHPLLAAVAMVVSSVTVIGNSLRIRGFPC